MPTVLHVTASPRGAMSISRKLGELYVERWLALHPGGTVITRDLMAAPVPYMDVDWIAGVYAPPQVPRSADMQAALDLSASLIAELAGADEVVISTPMYNYSVPAILKSWLDYLARPRISFALAPGWPALLADRPTRILIATRDVHAADGADDLVTPVIRRSLSFIGIKDVVSLLAGGSLGVNRGEVPLDEHVARFEAAITALIPRV
jgi:FMN-dependent NADH-azoreductase